MQATRRAFLLFTLSLGVTGVPGSNAIASDTPEFWRALDMFGEHCLAGPLKPEALALVASELGWTPLSAEATREFGAALGVVPGIHMAWRTREAPDDIVVEVGGTGAWSFAAQDEARSRGERFQGPMPNVAQQGADDRWGFSNHWTCKVHFRGGDVDAIIEHLLEQSVRSTEIGTPLISVDELENRPGWGAVDWHVSAERSHISFTYKNAPADETEFTRELSLGWFTAFDERDS